ncbi:MAG: hypothetical protein ACRC5A_03785 [Enterobacteriaceae bacterium]
MVLFAHKNRWINGDLIGNVREKLIFILLLLIVFSGIMTLLWVRGLFMFAKAKCSFLMAAGSILNIFPSVSEAGPDDFSTDYEMIASDWQNIGSDIQRAIEIYESEQITTEEEKQTLS